MISVNREPKLYENSELIQLRARSREIGQWAALRELAAEVQDSLG